MSDTPKPNAPVTREDRELLALLRARPADLLRNPIWELDETAALQLLANARAEAVEKALSTATEDRYNLALLNETRDLRRQLAEANARADALDSGFQKLIREALACNPIPACKRDDGELEPPWEAVARTRKDRAAARKQVEQLRDNCKIIYFPTDGSYPVEHNPHAKKLQFDTILALLSATAPTPPNETAQAILCPTCRKGDKIEIYPSSRDKSTCVIYCRRCEEGCVPPLIQSP